MLSQFALVIEDDKDTATFFAKALEMAGCNTEIIRVGDVAVARLAVTTPDLVVLDLHLPGIAGTDILRRIRTDARLAETRVIIVTGDPLEAEGVRDQADLVLIKPVGFDQLRGLAARLISVAP